MQHAQGMTNDLKSMMRSQPIYLKMDGATRLNDSYFAVNAQFIHDGNVVVKTLAVMDCLGKHTAEDTATMITEVMKKFELKKEQILGIVSDNASAMVKSVTLLNQPDEESDGIEDEDEDLAAEEEATEVDENEDETLVIGGDYIHLQRCAAHTLQLAIRHGLKKHAGTTSVIAKARALAKKLRAPNMTASLKKKKVLLPILDVETRWGSTFNMLKRLLQIKTIVQDYAAASTELHVAEGIWASFQGIVNVLEPPFAVTLRLQSSSLTPGTFLMEWVKLKKQLMVKGE